MIKYKIILDLSSVTKESVVGTIEKLSEVAQTSNLKFSTSEITHSEGQFNQSIEVCEPSSKFAYLVEKCEFPNDLVSKPRMIEI